MNRQFPALRGLAILLVVVNHAITLTMLAGAEFGFRRAAGVERTFLLALKELGVLAVPVFLFLSGVFMVYALQSRPLKTAYQIVLKGLKNVLLPYLLWSVVFYVSMFAFRGETASPLQYAKHLLVGYPFNFVPLLVFFYLLAPLLLVAAKRWPWLVAAAFGLYQIFLIIVLQQEALGLALPGWAYSLTPPVLRVTLAVWGIFFPLGLLYGLYGRQGMAGALQKAWPALLAVGLGLYVTSVLHEVGVVFFPLAQVLIPIPLILLMPLIQRDWLPYARTLEWFGKNAYGFYLTNLIMINLVLFAARALAPGLLNYPLVVFPLLILVALVVPGLLMYYTERLPGHAAYRFVFG